MKDHNKHRPEQIVGSVSKHRIFERTSFFDKERENERCEGFNEQLDLEHTSTPIMKLGGDDNHRMRPNRIGIRDGHRPGFQIARKSLSSRNPIEE